MLRRKGEDHERAYLDHLAADGLRLVELPEGNHDVNATRQALEDGPDVIARAWLADGRWVGCADVLLRVPGQSALGEYHYEVVDTKLATRTKPRTILQLCLYADLLAALQGRRPDRIKVVPPGDGFEPETYRVDQYEAYYRRVKAHLDAATGGDGTAYPEPCEHCNVCDWWRRCDTRRHDDDHLSLVAGIVEVRARAELHNTEGKKIGNVVGIDTIAMTVDIILTSPGLVVALASRQLPAKPFEVGAQIRNLLLLGRIPLGGCHAKVMPHFPNLYKSNF